MPNRPAPLFREFVGAALAYAESGEDEGTSVLSEADATANHAA